MQTAKITFSKIFEKNPEFSKKFSGDEFKIQGPRMLDSKVQIIQILKQ